VKPVAFDYLAAATLDEAIGSLDGEDTRVLAGGQSLGPMLNLRLATPKRLVDIGEIAELRRIEDRGDDLFLGAMVTHAAIEDGRDLAEPSREEDRSLHSRESGNPSPASRLRADMDLRLRGRDGRGASWASTPLGRVLSAVAQGIAYRSVRNKGTVGGSLAQADPAADWVTVLSALGARAVIAGPQGRREAALPGFFLGAFATDLGPAEIIAGVLVPKLSAAARWGYCKLCRKPGEYAEAMAAALLDPPRRVARIVLGAMPGGPVPLDGLAQRIAMRDAAPADRTVIAEAVAAAAPELDRVALRLQAAAAARALDQAVGA